MSASSVADVAFFVNLASCIIDVSIYLFNCLLEPRKNCVVNIQTGPEDKDYITYAAAWWCAKKTNNLWHSNVISVYLRLKREIKKKE